MKSVNFFLIRTVEFEDFCLLRVNQNYRSRQIWNHAVCKEPWDLSEATWDKHRISKIKVPGLGNAKEALFPHDKIMIDNIRISHPCLKGKVPLFIMLHLC